MKQATTSLFVLLALLLASPVAFAQTTYISSGSGNWSSAATWLPSGVPGSVAGDSVVIAAGTTVTLDVTPLNPLRGILVNALGTLQNGTGTFTLTFSPDVANAANVFTNNGTVNFQNAGGVANVVFTRADNGLQTINGSGTYTFNNLELTNTSPSLALPTASDGSSLNDAVITTSTQTLTSANPITINNLTVNQQAARSRLRISPSVFYAEDNPTLVSTNLNISGTLTLSRGALVLNPTPSATRTHAIANILIGSAGSNRGESSSGTTGAATNTVLVMHSAANATTTLNVLGDVTGFTTSVNAHDIAMATENSDNSCQATLNISGNFAFNNNARIQLVGNGKFSGGGTGSKSITVGGNFIMTDAFALFNGDRAGSATDPIITLSGGTSASPVTFNVNPAIWTGLNSNALCTWRINGFITIPSGSGLVVHIARGITINGGIEVQNGGEIKAFSDLIPGAPQAPTFAMGDNGVIRVFDPQGLGSGVTDASSDSVFTTQNPNVRWTTGSDAINNPTNGIGVRGTIEYAGTTAQVVTARAYNNLVINNAGTFTFPSTLSNQTTVNGDFSADTLDIRRGVFILSANSVARNHTANVVTIGSATSSAAINFNTGLLINNSTSSNTTLTVSGNFIVNAAATGGVNTTLAFTSSSGGSATLTVNGNFETLGSSLIQLAGHGTLGSVPNTFNFGGDVVVSSGSRFNAQRAGSTPPTVNLTGTSAIFNVPGVFFLGTSGETNAVCNWVIGSGANITMPSGSAIAIQEAGGISLTVNGTLNAQNGAELIATRTGAGSGNALLTMGASGVIGVADAEGLGDGLSIDPVSNFPLFIGRTSPTSSAPSGWNLSAINTNGTVNYNSAAAQAITPRSGASNYNALEISGGGAKSISANTATNTLALTNGIVNTGSNSLTVLSPLFTAVTGGSATSHINGNLVLTYNTTPGGRLFALGDGSVYRPLSVLSLIHI
jgi:hypothetical protein